MSVEEDTDLPETELKELVTQALEENGLLSKIRAQLRAGLYVALENEINETNKHCHINNKLKNSLSNTEIRTAFRLVIEFLEYFNLDFTKSVFEKESFLDILYDYNGKEKLAKELQIGLINTTKTPLLVNILNLARESYKYNRIIDDSVQNVSFINDSKNVNNETYDIPNSEKKVQADDLDSSKSSSKQDESISSVETNNDKKIQSNENSDKIKIVHKTDLQKLDTDDTYEGTSSLADDSVASNNKETHLIDLDKTTKIYSSGTNSPVATVKCLIDQTINEHEISVHFEKKPLKLDDESSKSNSDKKLTDKVKNSSSNTSISDDLQKTPRLMSDCDKKKHDKTKPMSALSSLADLPPLQLNKTRSPDTVLLPSLYSKEFRDKSNLKEIDKLLDLNFDSIDNYEEDDILSTSIDYDKHKNVNFLPKKDFVPVKLFDDKKSKIGDVNSNDKSSDNKKDGESTSISEDFDFNSNSDHQNSDKTKF